MARQRRAARLASIIRARLAVAATAARTGESLPGATTSWTASSASPSPSALTAPNPATAAAVGARRGLTGSQRVSQARGGDADYRGPGGDPGRDGDEADADPEARCQR